VTRLRDELPQRLKESQDGIKATTKDLQALVEFIHEAVAARQEAAAPEQPSRVQKAYAQELIAARKQITSLLDQAVAAVVEL
jgi:predicted RNA-binding Zn ribbon-like protein